MTPRNRALFLERGHAYVYLAYGLSWMLNVSSEAKGVGAGVLIRALEPLEGIALMQRNRGTERLHDLREDPGRLAQALRIDRSLDGLDLCRKGPYGSRTTTRNRARSQGGNPKRSDRHYARSGAGAAVLSSGEPVRERRQVAQHMRDCSPLSLKAVGAQVTIRNMKCGTYDVSCWSAFFGCGADLPRHGRPHVPDTPATDSKAIKAGFWLLQHYLLI